MARFALAGMLALSLAGAPSGARGQTDEGPTFQDCSGLPWGVATLEAGLLLTAALVAAVDRSDGIGVGAAMSLAAVVSSAVLSGVTQAYGVTVEPAMVFHHGIVGGALLGGLMSFSLRAAGERGDALSIVGVAGLIAGAGGAATYSVLRMERLAHDPRLVEEAHFLSWGPILAASLVGVVLTAIGLDELSGVIATSVGLAVLGVAITLAEVAIAEHPWPREAPPGEMTMPLFGWSGVF